MSTYLSLHYHIVFGTKNRQPLIAPQWRSRLHEYLGGTIAGLGGFSQGVSGVEDHVHLLVGLKATHTLADLMREVKRMSSMWDQPCTLPILILLVSMKKEAKKLKQARQNELIKCG